VTSRYQLALGKPVESKPEPYVGTKVFEKDGKINFVDTNNVFVGYDMGQSCCEKADWFILDQPAKFLPDELNKEAQLDGFVFDCEYFMSLEYLPAEGEEGNCLDSGGMVVFRLFVHKGHEIKHKYLHLFNQHNGYYSHGFEMTIDGKEIRSDSI